MLSSRKWIEDTLNSKNKILIYEAIGGTL